MYQVYLGPLAGKARLTVDKNGAIRITNLNVRTQGKRPLFVAATGKVTVADAVS